MKEHPIIDSIHKKLGPKGCFRPGVPRPWKWKGGRDAAQKRYRENNREKRNAQKREYYYANRDLERARQKKYIEANKEKVYSYNAKWQREFWAKIRMDMISAYGGQCSCCGEKEEIFLDLDHINNDGKKRRKEAGNGRQEILNLRDQSWPKDNHQLLCCNCNQGKARNKGICPHKKKNL